MISKEKRKITAVIYDTEKNLVTHIRVNKEWVAVGKIATQYSVSPFTMGEIFTVGLANRLIQLNKHSEFLETPQTRSNAVRRKVTQLIAEYSNLTEEEVLTLIRALLGENVPDEESLPFFAVLARKIGIPFYEFAEIFSGSP